MAALTEYMEAETWFADEDVPPDDRRHSWHIELRYRGQNFELSMPFDGDGFAPGGVVGLVQAFHEAHTLAYGFAAADEAVELVNVRLKAIQSAPTMAALPLPQRAAAAPVGTRAIEFDGSEVIRTPVFRRDDLAPGQVLSGPCAIEQEDATSLIHPGDSARVDEWGYLTVRLGGESHP